MAERIPNSQVDWKAMLGEMQQVAPTIWEKICQYGEPRKVGEVQKQLIHGYYVSYKGVVNHPIRTDIEAELSLLEGHKTDEKSLKGVMNKVADESSEGRLILSVDSTPYSPLPSALDKDEIFGENPETPVRITYSFTADRSRFRI